MDFLITSRVEYRMRQLPLLILSHFVLKEGLFGKGRTQGTTWGTPGANSIIRTLSTKMRALRSRSGSKSPKSSGEGSATLLTRHGPAAAAAFGDVVVAAALNLS